MNKHFDALDSKGFLSALSKMLVIVMIMGSVSSSPSNAMDTDFWTDWFSQEEGASEICTSGVQAHGCDGPWCDNHTLKCYDPVNNPIGIDATTTLDTVYFNETGVNEQTCGPGQVVVGMKCQNDRCGLISLVCARHDVQAARSDCQWTESISEEEPNSSMGWDPYYLVGLRCTGDHCDNSSHYVCDVSLPAAVTYSQGTGRWVSFCDGGGQGCHKEITQSVSTGGSNTDSRSRETANSLSVALSIGVKVGGDEFGGSVEENVTTTTSSSTAVSSAHSATKNWSNSTESKDTVDVDYKAFNVWKVWRWQVEVPASDGSKAIIETSVYTCTPDGEYPTYLPGEHRDANKPGYGFVGSCLIPR